MYDLRHTTYDVWETSYELRITNYELSDYIFSDDATWAKYLALKAVNS